MGAVPATSDESPGFKDTGWAPTCSEPGTEIRQNSSRLLAIAQDGEQGDEVGRQGGDRRNHFPRGGMLHSQLFGVEGLAGQVDPDRSPRPIHRITHYRMLHMQTVDADLVGASGL